MFNEVNNLLDVSSIKCNGDDGSGSLDSKHILLSDFTKDDGAFLVHHFISHFLKAQQISPSHQPPSYMPSAINVIVISFAQSFNHFHCVAQKFGLNLRQLRESGSLVFVEALKELGDAIIHQGRGREAAGEEEQENPFCSILRDGDMSQLYRRLNFYMEDQDGSYRRPIVILDNVSVLLSIGVPLLKLVTFCNSLVASVCRQKGGTLVAHLNLNDEDEQDRMLLKHFIHSCDCHLQITPLSLIQKSILRDAVSDLALHFLAKMKIMVIKDIEREDIEFVCKSLGCRPIASLDHFVSESLGSAELVEEVDSGGGKIVKITGIANPGKTVSVLIRGSNKLVLEEADRSIHDALCVIRCLVKKKAVVAGGGAPEIYMALRLMQMASTQTGMEQYCFRAFSEALEVIPYTLAENAGLNPVSTVTELRNRYAKGERDAGINVRKGAITNILEENVVQPLLVSTSAIYLSTETVRSIMKIDDVLTCVR